MLLIAIGILPVVAGAQNTTDIQAVQPAENVVTLRVGQQKQLEVKVIPASAAKQSLRYESGNTGFFTADAAGMLTGVHEGSSTLSVIAPGGVRADVQVVVLPAEARDASVSVDSRHGAPTTGILIGNEGGTIEIGRLERIIAHVLPYQVIGSNPFTITTSDPSVIEALDEAKVIRPVKEGTATITVKTLDGRHVDSVTYTVVPRRVEHYPAEKTYTLEPQRFGIRFDDPSETAARANSIGLYAAMRHTADTGATRLLLPAKSLLYIEPQETIHMVSNVQLDLNGSEIRLRPNDYARYVAFLFAEKENVRVLENASIVNGTLTGERDEKEKHFPNWAKTPETEGGCTIVFEEGRNNGIRNLTVRKSIGFNISSGLGSKSAGVQHFAPHAVSVNNLESGGFDGQGQPTPAQGLIRTSQPLDVSSFTTPHYTLGYPLGYMGYPSMNSRIYDAYFFDKDMKLLSADRGRLRYRQYKLPQGAAHLQLAFYQDAVPERGNSDFNGAVAFVENRAMPMSNYIIDCVIEDNYSCGFAACGGQNWLIQNNIFRRNGGRMPGCDIDWEDGWEYMQGDLVEGNTFESRLNVITCAGAGLVFRNNTFRGESVFYGRTQHYSLMDNLFEKAPGETAQTVKVSLSSQSDIYCHGDRFVNALLSYTRQHSKEPYVGTYEATFIDVIFDNSQLLPGHTARLTKCTFRNGSDKARIAADNLEDCTIEKGSYTAGGILTNAIIRDATMNVEPGKLLDIRQSQLMNPQFVASAACEGVSLEGCRITVERGESLVDPNNMKRVTLRDCDVVIEDGMAGYTLVGGWNASGAATEVTLDQVRFALPKAFEGYLHKFAWYPPADDARGIAYRVTKTDLKGFQQTDEKGSRSNAKFDIER